MNNIRISSIHDLDAFRQVSIDTFIETYQEKNIPSDIEFYTTKYFTTEVIKQELEDSTRTIFISEFENEIAGYIKLAVKILPKCIQLKTALEISRIYIRKKHYGTGLAQNLLTKTLKYALQQKVEGLYLAVWKENERALSFYHKCGFKICGETTFDWGTGKIDQDWWMVKRI